MYLTRCASALLKKRVVFPLRKQSGATVLLAVAPWVYHFFQALFGQGAAAEIPTTTLTAEDLTDGSIDILTVLLKSGLVPSKSEARRAVQQGGVSVDGEKVTDTYKAYTVEDFAGEGIVIKKGKKNFRKIVM